MEWQDKSILQAFDYISESDLKELVRRVNFSAAPLLQVEDMRYINHGGELTSRGLSKIRIVAGESLDEVPRLLFDEVFRGEQINILNIGFKDRICFYSLDMFFPPFIINGLGLWREEYERSAFKNHFDTEIQNRMLREGYSLFPNKGT